MNTGDPPATEPDGSDTGNEAAFVARLTATVDRLRDELLAARTPRGHWVGELSSSALSTATAISAVAALKLNGGKFPNEFQPEPFLRSAIDYLRTQQNPDGGFGDTDRSHSNIATSYLVWAASRLSHRAIGFGLDGQCVPGESTQRLLDCIERSGAIAGLRKRYGSDKTFVVPILANLAIAGCVKYGDVPQLPFEAAAVPQSFYRYVRMPVVSYAVPALVAIGILRHHHRPSRTPLALLRRRCRSRVLRVLTEMQPQSGGYLEAAPLTSFVLMSLAASRHADHPVIAGGIEFLFQSQRPDGSLPIDTNLATWVTSLAVEALSVDGSTHWQSDSLRSWIVDCAHTRRHRFTGADPGGWGWTDLSGAVPDGDDTPAAILALASWPDGGRDPATARAIAAGRGWLANLQNRDGGYPTFCRGWGRLPFDRSSVDLTAHALRAKSGGKADAAVKFLRRRQNPDGSWSPLWFGNQDRVDEDNPIYGTSRVLMATDHLDDDMLNGGINYLLNHQNADGGWGGGSSIGEHFAEPTIESSVEETALAIEALSQTFDRYQDRRALLAVLRRGVDHLIDRLDNNHHHTAWPIGFYFAKLWYYEKLYPLIFALRGLATYQARITSSS